MSLTIKNYKKFEGWVHNYKDFIIIEITETNYEYTFKVSYNKTPYLIKIFRQGTNTNDYEMILRDGLNISQYGRDWVNNRKLKSLELTALIFEALIVKYKPKAQPTTGNPNYSNGPF